MPTATADWLFAIASVRYPGRTARGPSRWCSTCQQSRRQFLVNFLNNARPPTWDRMIRTCSGRGSQPTSAQDNGRRVERRGGRRPASRAGKGTTAGESSGEGDNGRRVERGRGQRPASRPAKGQRPASQPVRRTTTGKSTGESSGEEDDGLPSRPARTITRTSQCVSHRVDQPARLSPAMANMSITVADNLFAIAWVRQWDGPVAEGPHLLSGGLTSTAAQRPSSRLAWPAMVGSISTEVAIRTEVTR
jgi:hypothetical protein